MRSVASFVAILLGLSMNALFARGFSEQQVWSYKTRAGEERSTVLINKVETDPKLGQIFHISVTGVRVKNRGAPSGVSTELPHFPVSKQTLEVSCTSLIGQSAPNPAYKAGYAEWKRAFDQGRAGVFTISIAEIVQFVEDAVSK